MYAALLAAFLALPGNHCGPSEAPTVVKAAMLAGERYDIPPDLLLAVVMAETKCRNRVSKRRFNGGVDVGYAQIHVHDPRSPEVGKYLDTVQGLTRSARILSWSRGVCTGRGRRWRGCKKTVWSLYNYNSKTWWGHVQRYLEAIRGRLQV